jgi:hypothetical protein
VQRSALLRLTGGRFRPQRWGVLLLFLGLLLLLRVVLGAPFIGFQPQIFVLASLLLAGYYALAPLPWLWTGDARVRPTLARGALQSLLWNTLWLGAVALLMHGLRNFLDSANPAPMVALIRPLFLHIPRELLLVGVNLPFAFVAGWLIAEGDAADRERADAEAARQTLLEETRAAQARALQAQLDPHVLHNALSALAELVREDPVRAEEALVGLSDLYRRLTRYGQQPLVRLGEERILLQDLLALEDLRLGTRLKVIWNWPLDLDDLELPPLLVQPLVENAVKHGIAPLAEGGELRLEARRESAGALCITIANTGLPLDASAADGTGLANLKARLILLDPAASLAFHSEGGWTFAVLRLPLGARP